MKFKITSLTSLTTLTLITLIFYGLRYYQIPRPNGNLNLYFLDVGQGDATLIQTPGNKLILVDGGPDGKVLMSKLSQFDLFGRCNLEAVILTHPDSDHANGLLEALKRCQIKTIIANTASCTLFSCQKFNELAPKDKVTTAVTNDSFYLGDVTFRVLNPPASANLSDDNTNDDSVVLNLEYGQFRALLMGDANPSKLPINNYQLSIINLLKVPHHGSANNFDPAFWEQVRPEVAIISVGKNNYGQPSDKVLGEATILGTKVLRTDVLGDIKISVDSTGKVIYE